MASGESSQQTPQADEVREASPQADRTILDNLSPFQAQRNLEAALQHYRAANERESGRPAMTASALLTGELLPATSSTGEFSLFTPYCLPARPPTASLSRLARSRSSHSPCGG